MRDQSHDYPAFPEIEAELGYNPARFLDHEIKTTSCTTELTVTSLIRGIEEISTIRAWIVVEVNLGRDDGGPRRAIITQLNRRQLQIEEAAAPSTTKNDRATTSATTEESTVANAERARDEEPSEPALDAPESASNRAATIASDREPVAGPTCLVCGNDLVPAEIAGQLEYWCGTCIAVHEPTETPLADATEQELRALADGREASTPHCSDYRAELTPEEVEDGMAHWCAHCGGFRDPIGGTSA